ncbi:STAS domain-containing protein [Amycolatopsis sp. cmx-4-83]|uniref:STAS domain-containing protein n=1 Tax=Amycolatopsis sp. cmx-4-83 TaxID=2790940 RepID=UPI00397DD202
MTTPLTLDTGHAENGTTVLTATGEVDLSNVADFTQALADATSTGQVTVDLRGIAYLDSGAVNALFTYADHIRLLAPPLLMPVLIVSGLTELVDVDG